MINYDEFKTAIQEWFVTASIQQIIIAVSLIGIVISIFLATTSFFILPDGVSSVVQNIAKVMFLTCLASSVCTLIYAVGSKVVEEW
ncbi:MAG: hypothetical protein K0U41_06355 [Gammaproteobacteria bacterium]|nr:hypothetical protein [Gammaproteobacteria bacterium]